MFSLVLTTTLAPTLPTLDQACGCPCKGVKLVFTLNLDNSLSASTLNTKLTQVSIIKWKSWEEYYFLEVLQSSLIPYTFFTSADASNSVLCTYCIIFAY